MDIQNIETLKAYKFPGVGLFPRFQSMQKQSKSLQNVLALSEKNLNLKWHDSLVMPFSFSNVFLGTL